MTVNWYNVGNKDEFLNKGIQQEEKTLDLEDLGEVSVVFLAGFTFSIIFNGEFLTPNLNGRNPFYRNETTSYIDENGDVWVGYAVNM